ncbi:UMP kinase [Myxococcota bacterium]|nr:UMP kinase [Myxococcota bacterium]MBU1379308.1 UMP kinase [Myxococcota bacterium]MBU1498798.1 UMP kinase [Myxococcota bacterium]
MVSDTDRHNQRVLLKISGEALQGNLSHGIDESVLNYVVDQVLEVRNCGIETAIVVGGGNYFRGITGGRIPRTEGDFMGMLATLMNAIAISSFFQNRGIPSAPMSSFENGGHVDVFNAHRAQKLLSEGHVLVFGGGTSNPFFTTDTAAVLRALEIRADVLVKATKVDGIFDKDPEKFSDAVKIPSISYSEVLERNLRVMDGAAIALARDNKLPVRIVNLRIKGAMKTALTTGETGSIVVPDGH